jgi:hypothetical protein
MTRKSEFSSYAEFIRETAATDPKIQTFRERVVLSQRDLASNTLSPDVPVSR